MNVRGCHPREEDTSPSHPRSRWWAGVHVCVFAVGLDDLTQRQAKDRSKVLAVLQKHGRFSVFEATANQVIATTMDSLVRDKLIDVDNSPGYPWSNVALTPKGLTMLEPTTEATP